MVSERLFCRQRGAGNQQGRLHKLEAPYQPGTYPSSALRSLWLMVGWAGIRDARRLSTPIAEEQETLRSNQGEGEEDWVKIEECLQRQLCSRH